MASVKTPAFHAHGCSRCDRRYMDTCKDLTSDALCFPCRCGLPPSVYDRSRLPQECCRTNSKPVATDQERAVYALAGAHRWWRCRSCSRTHPFDPAQAFQGEP